MYQIFQKFGATSEYLAPEEWYETCFILTTPQNNKRHCRKLIKQKSLNYCGREHSQLRPLMVSRGDHFTAGKDTSGTRWIRSCVGPRNNLASVCLLLAQQPPWTRASSFKRFLDHTQRRTTVGRNHLGEGLVRRRDLYLTTHNIHNKQTSMPPVGFEPTISAGDRPQTYALYRAAIKTSKLDFLKKIKVSYLCLL